MRLLQPLTLGSRVAPTRVMFGPIVTNLGGDDRGFSDRHVAFYRARSAGGCGIVVTEEASVHPSDWPYERAPLATRCGAGWRSIADACHADGALVIAALGHSGGQGSSAFNQQPLWAPSRVPEVNSREVPKSMEPHDIAAALDGFVDAARLAVASGCDGVEVNAGQHSLVRQFISGLTNQRDDEWGSDRLLFAVEVLSQVRAAVAGAVVGLRLSCDELAPWAGITPDAACQIAASLAEHVDYITVVRGSIYTVEQTRPDFHAPPGFNLELCRSVRAGVDRRVTLFLQGSIVDPAQAEQALLDGVCDGVEMTRAQLADPRLVAKLAVTMPGAVRPCIRCNQTCQVRDPRNPIISCVVEPSTGHESTDPAWNAPAATRRNVVVVGGGVAGLEAARVAALRGHPVRLFESCDRLGGNAAHLANATPFVDWLIAESVRLGVEARLGETWPGGDAGGSAGSATMVIQCTGSVGGLRPFSIDADALVLDIADVRAGRVTMPPAGPVVLFDPIGGPVAVALAEQLGERAVLLTQDQIAGNELSRTGDLAPANARLQQAGVTIERRVVLRHAAQGSVTVEDRFTGVRRQIPCAAVVDCGFRLPSPALPGADLAAGDCVAPRTILEAVLEARRAVLAIDGS